MADPRMWPQLMWRARAVRDRNASIESALDAEVEYRRVVGRQEELYSCDGRRPLRILLVIPKHDYGNPKRGLSYETIHFAGSLIEDGYEVLLFDFPSILRRHGRKSMNGMLRECAARLHPDMAFFVLFAEEIDPDVVEYIGGQGIPTFNWFCDDHWRYDSFSSRWAPSFSLVSTTSRNAYERYRRDGHKNVLKTQWGFNPYAFERVRPLPRPPQRDVVFIGQPHGDRKRVVRLLQREGLHVDTYGHGWPNGRVTFAQLVDLFSASKVVLGLSNDRLGTINQIKGRDFEAPAAGALYLVANNPELEEYLAPGKEIATYSDMESLISACKYYVGNRQEREQIAQAGRARVWRDHTYPQRMAEIFEALGFHKKRLASWD